MAQKADAGSKSSSFSLIEHRNSCIQHWLGYRKDFERSDFKSGIDETDGFKYLLLMDLESLEAYITDTRIQARLSFMLCVSICICGSLLLLVALGLGIASQLVPHMPPVQIAYLTGVAGIITQLISGVFFYFYNMTLRQINLFHSGLESSRKVCISLFLQSLMAGSPTEQNKARLELIKLLVPAGRSDQLDQADAWKQNKNP